MQGIQKRLGQRIKEMRQAKGFSQEAFGDLCGINRTHMGEIERGRWSPTLVTLYKVAKKLDTTISDLLKGIA